MTWIWLLPVTIFWPIAAVYLGGTDIRIEGGGGVRQLGGLLLTFVLFLAIWAAARAGLSAATSGAVLTVVVPTLLAIVLLPIAARVAFRILGVRLAGEEGTADAVA